MLLVQNGQLNLDSIITEFPIRAESCADTHIGHTPNQLSVKQALDSMMQPSDNQSTNALQEMFGNGNAALGRQRINNTAHTILQLSNITAINHKFRCGGPENNPANAMTLVDLVLLYQRLAEGILAQPQLGILDSIMLDIGGIKSLIREEAVNLNLSESAVSLFESLVKSRRKNGNLVNNTYQSAGGWLSIPNNEAAPSQFTFGIYTNNARPLGDSSFMREATLELLRPAIRKSLKTFQ
jgi:hypothetical protein